MATYPDGGKSIYKNKKGKVMAEDGTMVSKSFHKKKKPSFRVRVTKAMKRKMGLK